MLNAKFQDHKNFSSREEDFSRHIWAGQPSWPFDLNHLDTVLFPRPKEAPYKILL